MGGGKANSIDLDPSVLRHTILPSKSYIGVKGGGDLPPELSGTGPAKKERERSFAEAGFLAAAGSFDPDHRRPGPGPRSLSSLSRDVWRMGKNRRGAQNAKR